MEPLKFTLDLKTMDVVLVSAGKEEKFILRELSGTQRDKYLSAMSQNMKYDAQGRPSGLKSFEGMQALLLSQSITRADGSEVTKDEIQTWPASVQSKLFKVAQDISGLKQDEAEEAAKNG